MQHGVTIIDLAYDATRSRSASLGDFFYYFLVKLNDPFDENDDGRVLISCHHQDDGCGLTMLCGLGDCISMKLGAVFHYAQKTTGHGYEKGDVLAMLLHDIVSSYQIHRKLPDWLPADATLLELDESTGCLIASKSDKPLFPWARYDKDFRKESPPKLTFLQKYGLDQIPVPDNK